MRANQEMSHFAQTILKGKYAHTKPSGHKESWPEIAHRVAYTVMKGANNSRIERVRKFIEARKIMPGGRYLYAAGRRFPQINNCFLFIAEDSREGWADTMYKNTSSLMTGGGVGNVYSKLRQKGALVGGMGGASTGPCALMQMVNEAGRHIMQGGSRRSAVWAGLHWWHPDIFEFINLKNWSPEVQELKRRDFNFPAPMDGTNISVCLDGEFFLALEDESHPKHSWAEDIYWAVIPQMCRTGEPGFSVDIGPKELEWARNACTEVTSPDDGDMCNLVSQNMARFDSIEEFEEAVDAAAELMLYGTLYSPLPLERMYKVREKNRRLGLGLMGIHEWLLRRGKQYGPDKELGKWLEVYASVHQKAANHARKMGISQPVGTRAIAPTGTIAIIAETTSGIEPIFAVAQKRRYLNQDMSNTWKYQYIIDACAQRVIDAGVDPNLIEDAYDLAEDYERRIQFQAWTQQYVDHGISSTINMPAWGTSINNNHTLSRFGKTLLKYLPDIRGITVYPDGARDGQPLNRVPYTEAVRFLGQEFIEGGAVIQEFGNERSCVNGLCGL